MIQKANVAKPDIKHLAWAIDQRAQIQRTLLAFYGMIRERPQNQYPSWWEEHLNDHFLAAGFCLWRAVFLADKPRDLESVVAAQERFLTQVLSTNAITFPDDRTNSAWTVTFYLENAKLRIGAAQQFMHDQLTKEQRSAMKLEMVIRYVRLKGREPVDMRYEWQAAHTALRLLLNGPFTGLELPIEHPVHEMQSFV